MTAPGRPPATDWRRVALLAAAPPLLTLAVFWPATGFEFVSFDDPEYVSENRVVRGGLSAEGLRWAFNVGHAGNWHPLTWISHMLDVEWFGLDAGAHHRTNVVLHATNVLLVFALLRRLLALGRGPGTAAAVDLSAALVAALYGVHPLRLESVAWISERKDLLATVFFLLAVLAYLAWARRGGRLRYVSVALLMALSLMAKAMAVTLPLLLLLLDRWPLRRIDPCSPAWLQAAPRLILEKLPLVALAAGSAWLTSMAQQAGGAVASLATLPLAARIVNAAVSYVAYLADTLWPVALSVFYRYPPLGWPAWQILVSFGVLIAITAAALWQRAQRPWLLSAWLWFVIALLPVIGLIHVGAQSRADRYTYIPHIGLCIALVRVASAGFSGGARARALCGAGGVALLLLTTLVTVRQLPHWRNTETLFVRAAATTPGNYLAHYGLALEMARQGDIEESALQAELAVGMHPTFSRAYVQLGWSLARLGRLDEGLAALNRAIRLRPGDASAHLTLGSVLLDAGRTDEAARALTHGLSLDRGHAEGFADLAEALERLGHPEQAEQAYRRSLALDPEQPEVQRGLRELLSRGSAKAPETFDAAGADDGD